MENFTSNRANDGWVKLMEIYGTKDISDFVRQVYDET